MSEPASAFLTLRIPRASLVRWLDGPVRPASTWKDWRRIGGSYYFRDGLRDIAEITDEEMAEKVEDCDASLRDVPTNRLALRSLLDFAEVKFLKRCVYDDAKGEFVAGTLTYGNNLILYMSFLAIARGAADALEPDGTGIALIHSYVWSPGVMNKAMRLGPGSGTAFMSFEEHRAAIALFQPIADEMLAIAEEVDEDFDKAPEPLDVLDQLR